MMMDEQEEQHPTDQLLASVRYHLCGPSPTTGSLWGSKLGRDAPEVLWIGVFVFSKERATWK